MRHRATISFTKPERSSFPFRTALRLWEHKFVQESKPPFDFLHTAVTPLLINNSQCMFKWWVTFSILIVALKPFEFDAAQNRPRIESNILWFYHPYLRPSRAISTAAAQHTGQICSEQSRCFIPQTKTGTFFLQNLMTTRDQLKTNGL